MAPSTTASCAAIWCSRRGRRPDLERRLFRGRPRRALPRLGRAGGRAGIARVDGNLVLDLSRFPGRHLRPVHRTWRWASASAPRCPVSLSTRTPRRSASPPGGASAIAPRSPATLHRSAHRHRHRRRDPPRQRGVEFLPHGATARSGSAAVSVERRTYMVRVSLPAPERVVGERLRDSLRRAGVELTGTVRVGTETAARRDPQRLAAETSPPTRSRSSRACSRRPLGDRGAGPTRKLRLDRRDPRAPGGAGAHRPRPRRRWHRAPQPFSLDEIGIAKGQFALDDVRGRR